MLSKDSAASQASNPDDAKAGTAAASVPVLNPWDKIETASTGGGAINDPPGTDKPPCACDLELYA